MNTHNTTAAREQHEAANKAQADADAERQDHIRMTASTPGSYVSSDTALKQKQLYLACLIARETTITASGVFDAALSRAAIEDGDADAIAADPSIIATDLRTLFDKVEDLDRQKQEALDAADARLVLARESLLRIDQVRVDNGEPKHRPIPRGVVGGYESAAATLTEIDEMLDHDNVAPKHSQPLDTIGKLEREVEQMMINLELKHREEQKRAEEKKQREATRVHERKMRADAQAAEDREARDRNDRAGREQKDLAKAYRERMGAT